MTIRVAILDYNAGNVTSSPTPFVPVVLIP